MLSVLVAIIFCIYAGILFLKPRLTMAFLILSIIFDLGYFSRWFGFPQFLSSLPYYFTAILLLSSALAYLSGKIKFDAQANNIKLTLKFVVFMTILVVCSNIYNSESIVLGIYELRYFYIFLTLLIGFRYFLIIKFETAQFIKWIVIFGLIQIPFCAAQYIAVKYLGVRLSAAPLDMSSGTFSSYEGLVFVQSVTIACLFEYHLKSNKRLFNCNNYIIGILLIVPLLLSYSRTALGFVIATISIVYIKHFWYKGFSSTIKQIIPFVVIVCVVTGSFYQFFWKQHFDISKQFSLEYAQNYYFRAPKSYKEHELGAVAVMGRARAVVEGVKLILNDPITFFIGMGSGSVTEARFLGAKGRYYHVYGPLAGIGRTQFSKTITELGVIGLVAIVFFLNKLLILKRKEINFEKNKSIIINSLCLNLLFIFIMLSLYGRFFGMEISMLSLAVFYSKMDNLNSGS